jgi:hypothetical protein
VHSYTLLAHIHCSIWRISVYTFRFIELCIFHRSSTLCTIMLHKLYAPLFLFLQRLQIE